MLSKIVLIILILFLSSMRVFAGEQEKISQSFEKVQTMPNVVQLSIKEYVDRENKDVGSLIVPDSQLSKDRKLRFVKYLGEVGMSGKDVLASAQFKDLETNDILDVVFYVKIEKDNVAEIFETVIYKVNDQERFKFDQHGKRWPIIQNIIDDFKVPSEFEKLGMQVVIKDENAAKQ
ncbi:MAG: hypothetical protein H6754_00280 [Candidatus Omnitrophica bacterium]|nr:hypothetical protein [Candidatus Omnitrophota bacterium]